MRIHSTLHEIIAGLSTFFTIAYLFALCPQLLSQAGIDFGSALTATILTVAATTLFLSLYANYPLAVGPGLSVMSYLVFSVIGKNLFTWPEALGLVFWAGLAQFLLSWFELRQKILIAVPAIIKHASAAGLGLFFLAVGLKQLGIVNIDGSSYSWGELGTLGQAIGLAGLLLFLFFHWKRWRGGMLLPVLFCWMAALLIGQAQWNGLLSLPPPIDSTFGKLVFSSILEPKSWGVFVSILLISIFDAGATLTVLARMLGWLHKDGTIRNLNRVVIPDGIGSMAAAILGTTSCSIYIESSSGIRAGGRTAITGCTTAIAVLAALFFYPALSSIPLFATAPVLLGIGGILTAELRWVPWKSPSDAIPFLITAMAMPVFFSIYWGFALGFLSYVLVKSVSGKAKEIHPIVWGLAVIFAIHLFV